MCSEVNPNDFRYGPSKEDSKRGTSRARESRAGSVKFTPKFKVCIETNYAPVIPYDDAAYIVAKG